MAGRSLARLAAAAAFLAATALLAPAAEQGGNIRYEGGPGLTLFRHATHDTAGMRCSTCHTRLFPFRRGSPFTHAVMRQGGACGACHDGRRAFGTETAGACGRCHGG